MFFASDSRDFSWLVKDLMNFPALFECAKCTIFGFSQACYVRFLSPYGFRALRSKFKLLAIRSNLRSRFSSFLRCRNRFSKNDFSESQRARARDCFCAPCARVAHAAHVEIQKNHFLKIDFYMQERLKSSAQVGSNG